VICSVLDRNTYLVARNELRPESQNCENATILHKVI
jgi:hypothetical protein